MLSGNNSILQKATDAKEQTGIGQEKETIALAYNSALAKKVSNGDSTVVTDIELNAELTGSGASANGSNPITVTFENGHAYTVNSNGKIGTPVDPNSVEPTDIYVALCGDKNEEGDNNENGNILVFSNNAEDITSSYTIIENYNNIKGNVYDNFDNSPEWKNTYRYSDFNDIRKVIFLNEIVPENTAAWFNNLTVLSEIVNISNLNTCKVTDMSWMFSMCRSLTMLNLNSFNTAKVTNMSCMFNECDTLETLSLGSSFTTDNVTDMSQMFASCRALTSLNLNSFNTAKVTNMESMFHDIGVTNLDVSRFNTDRVTNMYGMFTGYQGTSLDLSNFSTINVTDMSWMFNSCSNLTTIYASSNFVVTNVSSDDDMFSYNDVLEGEKGTKFDSSNSNDKTYAHIDGGTTNPGYFTSK